MKTVEIVFEEIKKIHAEDGVATSTYLANRLKIGKEKVMGALVELEAAGRIKTRPLRGNDRTLAMGVIREF